MNHIEKTYSGNLRNIDATSIALSINNKHYLVNIIVLDSKQCNTVQYVAVQYSLAQYSTVRCSTVQCVAVQYSLAQYSTV